MLRAIAMRNRLRPDKGKLEQAIADLAYPIAERKRTFENDSNRRNRWALYELFIERARMFESLGRSEEEIADYTRSYEIHGGKFLMPLISRAHAYSRLGRKEEAVKDYELVQRLSPGERDVISGLIKLGVTPLRRPILSGVPEHLPNIYEGLRGGQVARARVARLQIELKRSQQEIKPGPLTKEQTARLIYGKGAMFEKGILYYRGSVFDEAIAHFEKVLEFDPNWIDAQNNLASAFAGKGELEKAISRFTDIIERRPDFMVAYFNRGVTYMYAGEHIKALRDFEKTLRLNGGFSAAYTNRGIARRKICKGESTCPELRELGLAVD